MDKIDNNQKRNIRLEVINTLYLIDLLETTPEEALDSLEEDVNEATKVVVFAIVKQMREIDQLCEDVLKNYRLNRLSYLDRALVRLIIFEMKEGLPLAIAINEALEIARIYSDSGDEKNIKFLNRFLQNVNDYLKVKK